MRKANCIKNRPANAQPDQPVGERMRFPVPIGGIKKRESSREGISASRVEKVGGNRDFHSGEEGM